MPEMDGFELFEQLQENTATVHIPVILLTSKVLARSAMLRYSQGRRSHHEALQSPHHLATGRRTVGVARLMDKSLSE